MDASIGLSGIPSWAIIPLAVVAVIQVSLAVYALIDLAKTPTERVQTGKKWVWVLLILFVNFLGAIVYLAAGKKPAAAEDPSRAVGGVPQPTNGRATRAADLLYGSSDEAEGDAS